MLLPYVVFSAIMMLTTGSWSLSGLLSGSFWHLWFLPTLMWCFVIGYFLHFAIKRPLWACLAVCASALCALVPNFLPMVAGLKNLTGWFVFFVSGNVVCLYRERIWTLFRSAKLHIVLLIVGVALSVVFPTIYGEKSVLLLIAQFCVILPVWYIVATANLTWMDRVGLIALVDESSFGLYIFHNWFGLYLVSNTMKRIFNLEHLLMTNTILFPLALFLLAFALSLLVTHTLRKTRVGRLLL